MSRELSESRQRLQEDQLAELQEELRRFSESSPYSGSLHTVSDIVTPPRENKHSHGSHQCWACASFPSAGCDDSAGRAG